MNRGSAHVLIVDDEQAICWSLRRLLEEEGYSVDVASSAEDGLERVKTRKPQLLILDVRLPGIDGLSAIPKFRQQLGAVPMVLITAFGNLQTAIAAQRGGVVEYLTKPFDLAQVVAAVQRALAGDEESAAAAGTPGRGRTGAVPGAAESQGPSGGASAEEILGASPAMQEVFKKIAIVAATEVPVVISGESGTGKELVARAIHRHSRRADRPMIPVHLASLSPSLVESELFGHVRGAFTGADNDRLGMLELAHEATVFFDEAADIPPQSQVKLLRVLEQRELLPVGGTRTRPCDFRVIVATNRDLRQCVADETFRQDLFYRLAGFEIVLPPLRERGDDILILAEHFLRSARVRHGTNSRFSQAAIQELKRRSWPGNVRELRNAVEYGALLARNGLIVPEHLPPEFQLQQNLPTNDLQSAVREWARQQLAVAPDQPDLYERFLAEVEPALFHTVLERVFQNRSAAAEILGIHRATLRKRLE
ncbi:MAG: sigma-54-dependent Fis family transcriptional regulator [Planctomycetes bacterium]|nr:sigma-54-dependent Fis family transcriptional regulator [Planctomycetota bacterium]